MPYGDSFGAPCAGDARPQRRARRNRADGPGCHASVSGADQTMRAGRHTAGRSATRRRPKLQRWQPTGPCRMRCPSRGVPGAVTAQGRL